MQEYVAGFLFDDDQVVLVKKNRPPWQAGKYNGVGGKVEPGEAPYDAMVREFEEEAGVRVESWKHFITLKGTQSTIYCYTAFDADAVYNSRTMEEEPIHAIETWSINGMVTVPNVQWLVPLARQAGQYKPITVEFCDRTTGTSEAPDAEK